MAVMLEGMPISEVARRMGTNQNASTSYCMTPVES